MEHMTHNSIYQVRELAEPKSGFTGVRAWLPDYQ